MSEQQKKPGFEEEYPDTDLYMYFGPIRRPYDTHVIKHIRERKKKKNIMVFMTTPGGDPDAAYRIARGIQHQYGVGQKDNQTPDGEDERRFYLFVDSLCTSAGTLVALGTTHLILSDYAELGPLDAQLRRPDEPRARDSGLTLSPGINQSRKTI